MKCPNDKTDMDKGVLWNQGATWLPWPNLFINLITALARKNRVYAFKSPTCGKIELYSEQPSK